jgi:outer membrane protein assembly factor BamB
MNGASPNSGGSPVENIFHAALELDADRRAAHLDHACGADEKLRARVESLLRAAGANAGFLPEQPNPKFAASLAANAAIITEQPGDRIGRYTLLEQIGAGGFGVVFKARQEEPIRRTVALKIVKLGMDTREVIARFESERQTLALMDHPNIARVLDAGATDTGRPYFVMELVDGVSITEYCDRQRLSTPRRLVLFTQVCRAIQHAHEKGVIHRDIKPSNVLVTVSDGAPVPKVIDFGIAKATAQSFAFNTVATALGVLGTPAYMSPEQADLQRADIDTRSDIYSLGVLLYELLAGQPPFQPAELSRLALDEVLRTIREQEPPPPSVCVTRLVKQKLTDTAQQRETEPSRLPYLLRGDLDCIAMKCLEKDRERRYDSASALARDVQRHLANEPITALRPSPGYRMQKMVRRHRLRFAAGAAASVVALGALLYWWFLPGTLSLEVIPADAQVEIDGRDYSDNPMPRQIKLSAGVHQVRFHKANYNDEPRTVVVPRGGFINIPYLVLKHVEGTLNVEGYPSGIGIKFAGIDYYGGINERATDTGTHDLTGFAEGCFEEHRTLTIGQGEKVATRLSLERGVAWSYPSTGIQGDFIVITNTPPDQPPVIVHNELNRIVFISSADGSVLGGVSTPNGNVNNFNEFDLGGDAGRVIVSGLEERGPGPMVMAFGHCWPTNHLWTWRGPPSDYGDTKGLSIIVVPNAGRAGSLAVAGRDGFVRVINARTGKTERPIQLAANAPIIQPVLSSWIQDGRTLLLALLRSTGTIAAKPEEQMYRGKLFDVATGAVIWEKDLGAAIGQQIADFDRNGTPSVLLWNENRWRLVDALTSEPTKRGEFAGHLGYTPGHIDVEGKGVYAAVFQFEDPSLPLMVMRPSDGTTIWLGPTNVARFQFTCADGSVAHTADGVMLVALNDRLAGLRTVTGQVLWDLAAKPRDLLVDEKTGNIYVLFTDKRLFCLDSGGRTNWILRLEEEISPRKMVPDRFGGGHEGILLSSHGSQIALAHWPRLLWTAAATGQLQAAPQVVRDPRGNAVVVQLGSWGDDARLAGLDGTNGRLLWSNHEFYPPNRPPALGAMDADGVMDVVIVGETGPGSGKRLVVRRATDGKIIRCPPSAMPGWHVGGMAADFRGIGRCDLAFSTLTGSRPGTKPCIAIIDGATGALVWEHDNEGPNNGSLAVADLDGDGLVDVVATSLDGHVYALRGMDGTKLWITPGTNYPSRAPPIVADLNGDGKLQVLLTTEPPETGTNERPGGLFVLDAADGRLIWSPNVAIAGTINGSVTVARVEGRTLILAPMRTNGVVVFDWATKEEVWRSPKGYSVITTPVVADLAHDGRQQVVIAAYQGDVFVLNLLDGQPLCQLKVAQNRVGADPVVADLNNDGVDDILIASYDFRLYAINGRTVLPPHNGSLSERKK